jgi:hypothetical protein
MRGLVDFRAARPLDRDWWMAVAWALAWLEQRLYCETAELKYQLHVGLLDYRLTERAFDHHWDQAQALQQLIHNAKLPWLKIEAGVSKTAIASMEQTWKAIFGDPADPEVARKIEETAAALRGRAARARENGNAGTRR